ncbi:unnamed protein product [Ixodes hexagonus]
MGGTRSLTTWQLLLLFFCSCGLGGPSTNLFKRDPTFTFCSRYNCCPRGPSQVQMDCSDRNVTAFAHAVFPSGVQMLSLKHNSIKKVDAQAFVSSPRVVHLDLSHNKIDFLEAGSLSNLSGLTSFGLSHNRLWRINGRAFQGVKTLVRLDLGYNQLQTLYDDDFKELGQLEELVLDRNPLAHLSGNCFRFLENLKVLSLNSVGYTHLSADLFVHVGSLIRLSLVGNGFRSLPATALERLYELRSLDVSQNPLTHVGASCLRQLPSLRTLRLNDMYQLTSVDEYAFGNLPGLKELYLNYNPKLSSFHDDAFRSFSHNQFVQLDELYLRQTALQTLSSRLQDWGQLAVADFAENPWNCDCRLGWMAHLKIKTEAEHQFRCTHPLSLQGRLIPDLTAADFSCDKPSLAELTTSIVMLSVMLLVSCASVLGVLVYRQCSPTEKPDYSRVWPSDSSV